jgi:hypothetical protein
VGQDRVSRSIRAQEDDAAAANGGKFFNLSRPALDSRPLRGFGGRAEDIVNKRLQHGVGVNLLFTIFAFDVAW